MSSDDDLLATADAAEGQWGDILPDMSNFWYDQIENAFRCLQTGNLISSTAMDAAIARDAWQMEVSPKGDPVYVPPSKTIARVEFMQTYHSACWIPGEPTLIRDLHVSDGREWVVGGRVAYNHYRPPVNVPGSEVVPREWLNHLVRLYPDEVEREHFLDYAAHMLQKPEEKCNHAVVLSGRSGIGKDTLLAPLRWGVGHANSAEIGPDEVVSAYNAWAKTVMLVVNEVRPAADGHMASTFYNKLKPLIAAPPDYLLINPKYGKTFDAKNCCRVFLTTNHLLSMHIPEEDRRMFVMNSPLMAPPPQETFTQLYGWLQNGGRENVVAWLRGRDLSNFDAGAPPPMTAGKQQVIDAHDIAWRTAVQDVALGLREMFPDELLLSTDLQDYAKALFDDAEEFDKGMKASNLHYKLGDLGFSLIQNKGASDGRYIGRDKDGKRLRARFVLGAPGQTVEHKAVMEAMRRRPLNFDRSHLKPVD